MTVIIGIDAEWQSGEVANSVLSYQWFGLDGDRERKDVRIELSNLFFKCSPGKYEKPTKQKNICYFKLSEDGKIEEYTAYFQDGGIKTIKVF